MIFPPPLYGKVLRGEKTQTRRLLLPIHPRHKYRLGKRLAVQKGSGFHSEAHIILTDVQQDWLGNLDYEAARAEGFRTTHDFKTWWLQAHDAIWLDREAGDDDVPGEDLVTERFDRRWAERRVWVLTFQLDRTEQPTMLMQGSPLTEGGKARLLSNRRRPPGRATSTDITGPEEHGYTQSPPRAMPREPEPVDKATQKRYAQEGSQEWLAREARRQDERERLDLVERLRRALEEGGDPRVEESIRKRIRALESKNRRRT